MRPVILIVGEDGFDQKSGSPHFVMNQCYSELIVQAGGIPVVALDIRVAEEYAQACDGLLLTGGPNIHVGRFGGIYKDFTEMTGFSNSRDDLDFELVKQFDKVGKPVFGIGRGLEVINVYFGGDLCRNMKKGHKEANMHGVTALQNSFVRKIYGEQSFQNSFHEQCIHQLGAGMQVAAKSMDGIIEAAEYQEKRIFGVMWHPERDFGNVPANQKIFEYFMNCCG